MTASTRRRADSIAAEAAFRAEVAKQGGQVLEPNWLGSLKPHRVRCAQGHEHAPRPNSLQQGNGLCRASSWRHPWADPAEKEFRARIAELGGTVIGEYKGRAKPVACICKSGHECSPRPDSIQQGRGMCLPCSGNDPALSEAAFRDHVTRLSGAVVGEDAGANTPVACICPNGHKCRPRPADVRQGVGLCGACRGATWDVFYVVASPAGRRVKFGVTSRDERRRLSVHRSAGYTDVVRVLSDFDDAAALERHVRAVLRDAGITPEHGREYFSITALGMVLNIVDSWASA